MDAGDAAENAVGNGGEDEEEEGGETRCVCEDSGVCCRQPRATPLSDRRFLADFVANDDLDAAGFMIQCEMCKAWQHGLCMGFASESAIPQGDYYCEQCKPEDHVELLKYVLTWPICHYSIPISSDSLLRKASRRQQRQGSEKSHHTSHVPRTSRSHSPSYLLKPPKRRNTMNSRDAAYEESLKELLDSTANEAGAPMDDKDIRGSTVAPEEGAEDYVEMAPPGRKKRKRTDDDQYVIRRWLVFLTELFLGYQRRGSDQPRVHLSALPRRPSFQKLAANLLVPSGQATLQASFHLQLPLVNHASGEEEVGNLLPLLYLQTRL